MCFLFVLYHALCNTAAEVLKSVVLHTLILIITSHAYVCFVIYMLQHHGELLKSAAPHSPILIITIIDVAFGANSFLEEGLVGGWVL